MSSAMLLVFPAQGVNQDEPEVVPGFTVTSLTVLHVKKRQENRKKKATVKRGQDARLSPTPLSGGGPGLWECPSFPAGMWYLGDQR